MFKRTGFVWITLIVLSGFCSGLSGLWTGYSIRRENDPPTQTVVQVQPCSLAKPQAKVTVVPPPAPPEDHFTVPELAKRWLWWHGADK
jgi:hypothetical protein